MTLFNNQFILGETQQEVSLETARENKKAVISLAKQACNSIDILTQDMDANIYNNKYFEQCVFRLARQHPKTLIRILVQDTTMAVKNGHCLIRLAQHLSSSVLIHNPSRDDKNERINFMLVDNKGVYYRAASLRKSYKAIADFNAPHRAKLLLDNFDTVWQQSKPDTQTRRLYV